jgi:hypothetical protein
MSIRLSHLGIVVLALSYSLFPEYAHSQSDLRVAESVAIEYMTAFFRGDFEKAAKLTHPDTLATLKQTFIAKLDQAQAEGRQSELLKEIGIKADARTLRSMNPDDLYVTIVKSNQKRGSNDALKGMARTTVEVVSSELLNANEAAVRVRIKIPDHDGVDNRAGGLLLRRYKKYWRVRTNL